MSPEQPLQNQALAGRRQIPINLGQLKRTPVLNVIGVPELVGLSGAALLALITIFAYFYFFVPSHSRLNSARLERDLLLGKLQATQKDVQQETGISKAVNDINTSLEDFESKWLAARDTGRMSLYTTLNNLIRSNGLRNTAGPSYTALDPLGTKQQVQPTASAEKQSNAKWQTIYPGIAVTVTVEGPYQKVWHFVRDLETTRQTVILTTKQSYYGLLSAQRLLQVAEETVQQNQKHLEQAQAREAFADGDKRPFAVMQATMTALVGRPGISG